MVTAISCLPTNGKENLERVLELAPRIKNDLNRIFSYENLRLKDSDTLHWVPIIYHYLTNYPQSHWLQTVRLHCLFSFWKIYSFMFVCACVWVFAHRCWCVKLCSSLEIRRECQVSLSVILSWSETESLPESGALSFSVRPTSPSHPPASATHRAIVTGVCKTPNFQPPRTTIHIQCTNIHSSTHTYT